MGGMWWFITTAVHRLLPPSTAILTLALYVATCASPCCDCTAGSRGFPCFYSMHAFSCPCAWRNPKPGAPQLSCPSVLSKLAYHIFLASVHCTSFCKGIAHLPTLFGICIRMPTPFTFCCYSQVFRCGCWICFCNPFWSHLSEWSSSECSLTSSFKFTWVL